MIQRLNGSNISFCANEMKSARDMYQDVLNNNYKIAQQQNQNSINNSAPAQNSKIAMQGQGQKLDVIA